MDLPAGRRLAENLHAQEIDPEQKLSELLKQGFTGYVCVTVEGAKGIEEATLLIKKGVLVGAVHEYTHDQSEALGQGALESVLNTFRAPYGVIDINALTNQQLDLIIAFQEKVVLDNEVRVHELRKLLPRAYTSAKKEPEDKEGTKFDVFKKLGIIGVE